MDLLSSSIQRYIMSHSDMLCISSQLDFSYSAADINWGWNK